VADIQEQHKNVSKAVLGIISLSVVFFPTVFSAISKPYVLDWVMYAYWICAFFSFIFLLCSYYVSAFSEIVPVRTIGFGNLLAAMAVFALFVFVFGNIVSDRLSKPRVTEIRLSNYEMKRDGYLEISGFAYDDDGDDLVWDWCIRPGRDARAKGAKTIQLDRQSRTMVWWPSKDMIEGQYFVEAAVSDGSNQSLAVRKAFKLGK